MSPAAPLLLIAQSVWKLLCLLPVYKALFDKWLSHRDNLGLCKGRSDRRRHHSQHKWASKSTVMTSVSLVCYNIKPNIHVALIEAISALLACELPGAWQYDFHASRTYHRHYWHLSKVGKQFRSLQCRWYEEKRENSVAISCINWDLSVMIMTLSWKWLYGTGAALSQQHALNNVSKVENSVVCMTLICIANPGTVGSSFLRLFIEIDLWG